MLIQSEDDKIEQRNENDKASCRPGNGVCGKIRARIEDGTADRKMVW